MKSLHHRPSRRAERLNWSATALQRKAQKKALLVGIQYEADVEDSDDEEANVLRGPHQDVIDMRALLIGKSTRTGMRTLTNILIRLLWLCCGRYSRTPRPR